LECARATQSRSSLAAAEGAKGKVIKVFPETDRILVEGVNRIEKHVKVTQTAAWR
jgi:ribosomal protein L24